MVYSDFTLDDVKRKLGVTVREATELFADIPPATPSNWLVEHLRETVPLALAIDDHLGTSGQPTEAQLDLKGPQAHPWQGSAHRLASLGDRRRCSP